MESGVNYIDTAVPYPGGESERFLGRALKDGCRERVKIATTLPPWSVKTRDDMDRILDIQLKNLQTDHIDYYLLHGLDAGSWKKLNELGVLGFLDAAKASGKIINAGFSFHGDRRTFKEITDAYDWIFCQIQYNFLDELNRAGTEGLEYEAAKKIAVMIMDPLRGDARRKTPERCRSDLPVGAVAAVRSRVGAPVGLEPPGSYRRPLGHERREANRGKHQNLRDRRPAGLDERRGTCNSGGGRRRV